MMDAIYRWGLAPWDLTLSFAPLPPHDDTLTGGRNSP